MIAVTLNSIQMNTGNPDGNGALWYVQAIDGWDSPTQRITSIQIPTRQGEVTVQNIYGPRTVLVKGLCKAIGANGYFQAKDFLIAQTNFLMTTFPLVVYENVAKTLNVIRSAEIRTAMIGKGSFTFEVNVKADDPLKYGVGGPWI